MLTSSLIPSAVRKTKSTCDTPINRMIESIVSFTYLLFNATFFVAGVAFATVYWGEGR
jgi:hypothetical protein